MLTCLLAVVLAACRAVAAKGALLDTLAPGCFPSSLDSSTSMRLFLLLSMGVTRYLGMKHHHF